MVWRSGADVPGTRSQSLLHLHEQHSIVYYSYQQCSLIHVKCFNSEMKLIIINNASQGNILHDADNTLPNARDGYSVAYCCFFCAAGPISFSKAPYETCKLPRALRPTPRILSSKKPIRRPINSPMLVSKSTLSIFGSL